MPDAFVPYDTTFSSKFYNKLLNSSVLYDFSFRYSDEHRDQLYGFANYKKADEFLKRQGLYERVLEFAKGRNVACDTPQSQRTKDKVVQMVRAYVLRNIYGDNAFYDVYYENDPVIKEALRRIKDDK